MKWSNTTYYDDEGLQYLIERLMNSATGLNPPPGHPVGEKLIKVPTEVWVRYYGGKLGVAGVHVKTIWAGDHLSHHTRLRVGISRRNDLFGSELETVAALGGEDPMIPRESLREIAYGVLLAVGDHSLGNALRQEFRDQAVEEPNQYGWPKNCAYYFLDTVVLPSCEVAICEKARKGASHEQKLTVAIDRVRRCTSDLTWLRIGRQELQQQLKEAVEREQKGEVAFAKARAKLAVITNKKTNKKEA